VSQFSLEGMPDAPVVVLSSALGTTHELWSPQLEAFTPRLQLVRYDHPGHGGSPVQPEPLTIARLGETVLATMERLGLARVSFCGLSLGGCVGQWLAVEHPQRLERLVLACTSPRFFTRESWLERAETVRTQGLEAIADNAIDRWLSPGNPRRAELRAMLVSTDPEGYARCCEALADFDLRDRVGTIEAPTLVVHGTDDPSVTREDVELLTSIPGSRLVELEGARHLGSVDRPQEFSAAVLEFLA
jgi:3-oxoadipate enol-lactonase